MNIASHNSFSYLPVRRWWMWPFRWMARCQRVDFDRQLELGAGLFDLRIRYTENNDLIICHGLMEYRHPKRWTHAETFLGDFFDKLNKKGGYCRVVLETNKPDSHQEDHFRSYCYYLQTVYRNIHFFGGNNRTDWGCKNPIFNFGTKLEDLDDKYSSTTNLFPWAWMRRLDDLCPIIYAKLHNKENVKKGTTHKWLFIDFVDIR